eukprot:COSAG01_NODE_7050_length_3376_cov_2.174855_4_plen_68_part_00
MADRHRRGGQARRASEHTDYHCCYSYVQTTCYSYVHALWPPYVDAPRKRATTMTAGQRVVTQSLQSI